MTDVPEPARDPVPSGWEGILHPGERILWQGRPEADLDWWALLSPRTAFGLFFAGFAVFWMAQAWRMSGTAPPLFRLIPLFGLPFLIVGLNQAGGHLVLDALRRRGTWYTLTDRTAFVATRFLGRQHLERHPLTIGMRPVLDDGDPGSIRFHGPGSTGGWTHALGRSTFAGGKRGEGAAGFHRIREARQVFATLTQALAALQQARS